MHRARGPDVAPAVDARVGPVLERQLREVGLVLVTPLTRRFQCRGREGAGFVLRPVEFQDIVLRVRRRCDRFFWRRAVSLDIGRRSVERGSRQLALRVNRCLIERSGRRQKGRCFGLGVRGDGRLPAPRIRPECGTDAEKQHAADPLHGLSSRTSHEQHSNGPRNRVIEVLVCFFKPEPETGRKTGRFERFQSTTTPFDQQTSSAKRNPPGRAEMGRGRHNKTQDLQDKRRRSEKNKNRRIILNKRDRHGRRRHGRVAAS